MNSLYGEKIRKHIDGKFCCKSKNWMRTEYDERVKDSWTLPTRNNFVKLAQDEGLGDYVKKWIQGFFL